LRYFIAIDLPRNIVDELVCIQQELKRSNLFSGKFVEPANLHLTLCFLGYLDVEALERVKNILRTIQFEPFIMSLGTLGLFVPECPRIIWIDLQSKGVVTLQKLIDQKISTVIGSELKPFVSHVTLARIKQVFNQQKLLQKLEKITVKPLVFTVNQFILKRSELTRKGPRALYTFH